jgi:hypothetical protein
VLSHWRVACTPRIEVDALVFFISLASIWGDEAVPKKLRGIISKAELPENDLPFHDTPSSHYAAPDGIQTFRTLREVELQSSAFLDLISADMIEVAEMKMCFPSGPVYADVSIGAITPEAHDNSAKRSEPVRHRPLRFAAKVRGLRQDFRTAISDWVQSGLLTISHSAMDGNVRA